METFIGRAGTIDVRKKSRIPKLTHNYFTPSQSFEVTKSSSYNSILLITFPQGSLRVPRIPLAQPRTNPSPSVNYV